MEELTHVSVKCGAGKRVAWIMENGLFLSDVDGHHGNLSGRECVVEKRDVAYFHSREVRHLKWDNLDVVKQKNRRVTIV